VLTDCRVVETGDGWALAQMPLPKPSEPGPPPLGWLGALADVSTAQAVTKAVGPNRGIRTVGLRLDSIGAVPAAGAIATGRGELLRMDGRTGLSRASLYGPDGEPFALCTGRFIVLDADPGNAVEGLATDWRIR
jgi:hypothetical protein